MVDLDAMHHDRAFSTLKCNTNNDCNRCLVSKHSNTTDGSCAPEGQCLGFDSRSIIQVLGRSIAPLVLHSGNLTAADAGTVWSPNVLHLVEAMTWVRPEIR